jgi:hypothetical protein
MKDRRRSAIRWLGDRRNEAAGTLVNVRRGMSRNFSHQLARSAKVWSATMEDGAERRILVIVTTIELDPKHDRYSKDLVGSSRVRREKHLAQTSTATGFVLVSRPKDWPRA